MAIRRLLTRVTTPPFEVSMVHARDGRFIAFLLVASLAPSGPVPAGSPTMTLDEIARGYVELSLAIGELSVSDLSIRVGCQVPNMSQHLAVLRRAGLVTSRRDGNTILYRLTDDRVLEAYRLIQDIAR